MYAMSDDVWVLIHNDRLETLSIELWAWFESWLVDFNLFTLILFAEFWIQVYLLIDNLSDHSLLTWLTWLTWTSPSWVIVTAGWQMKGTGLESRPTHKKRPWKRVSQINYLWTRTVTTQPLCRGSSDATHRQTVAVERISQNLRFFPTPLSFNALALDEIFRISRQTCYHQTGAFGISYTCVVLTQCQHVIDGQTDRQKDGRTDNPSVTNTGLCIASNADAL